MVFRLLPLLSGPMATVAFFQLSTGWSGPRLVLPVLSIFGSELLQNPVAFRIVLVGALRS
jgi:hypothetical protein